MSFVIFLAGHQSLRLLLARRVGFILVLWWGLVASEVRLIASRVREGQNIARGLLYNDLYWFYWLILFFENSSFDFVARLCQKLRVNVDILHSRAVRANRLLSLLRVSGSGG